MLVRRFLKIAFPLAAIAACSLFLSGCHHGHCKMASPEKKAEKIVKHISKELNLNAEQKTKLEQIKGNLLARKGDFQSMHIGLKDMLLLQIRSSKVDASEINQNLEAREAKMKELRGVLVSEFVEFHSMLDSSQREKLAARIEAHCR